MILETRAYIEEHSVCADVSLLVLFQAFYTHVRHLMLKGVSYANFGRFMQCFGPYFYCVLREFIFIIKTTNKFAMNSRQPDSGLRQYNCTGQDRLLVPLGEKYTKIL